MFYIYQLASVACFSFGQHRFQLHLVYLEIIEEVKWALQYINYFKGISSLCSHEFFNTHLHDFWSVILPWRKMDRGCQHWLQKEKPWKPSLPGQLQCTVFLSKTSNHPCSLLVRSKSVRYLMSLVGYFHFLFIWMWDVLNWTIWCSIFSKIYNIQFFTFIKEFMPPPFIKTTKAANSY